MKQINLNGARKIMTKPTTEVVIQAGKRTFLKIRA